QPVRIFSLTIHPSIAAQTATQVFKQASAALPSAAIAEPPLKPNQPNHSSAAPSITSGRLCGVSGSFMKLWDLPMMSASTRPATPALMWMTVPPAKSMGAIFATVSAPSTWVPKSHADRLLAPSEESTAPDHVGHRRINQDDPYCCEDQPGVDLHPVGQRAGDDRGGDHGKGHLKQDVDGV